MADEFDDPILPETQDTEDTTLSVEPEVQPQAVVPQPTIDPMQMRVLEAQEQSRRILEQIAQRQAMSQRQEPEPQYDPQIVAAAKPLIQHVLKEQLGEVSSLKQELETLKQFQRDAAEEQFVRSQVPDFDQRRDDAVERVRDQ